MKHPNPQSQGQGVSEYRNILHVCGGGASNILSINMGFLGSNWVHKNSKMRQAGLQCKFEIFQLRLLMTFLDTHVSLAPTH